MIDNPLNQNREIRHRANQFVLRWITGAPYTHILIRQEFTEDVISDKSKIYSLDLLMNYIAGMTLIKIDNKDADDLITQEAGVRAMLEGYKSIKDEYKIQFLDSFLKVDNEGKLLALVRIDKYIWNMKGMIGKYFLTILEYLIQFTE